MRIVRVLVVLALATVAGCTPQESPPEQVETLVVYSLDPSGPLDDDEIAFVRGRELFQRYLVNGSATVADPKLRKEVVTAVQGGIDDAEQDPTKHKLCLFSPQHGVHHVAKDGTATDWVICFSCRQVKTFRDGKPLKVFDKEDVLGGGLYKVATGNITHGPQKLLNDTLRSAGVKLADGADKGE